MACAMPHAMERSVATPTMKARLPARNPMMSLRAGIMPEVAPPGPQPLVVARVQTDAQLLSGVQARARGEAIPGEQLRHAALEEPRDLRDGVALAHRVEEPPVSTGAARSAGGARGQPDVLPGAQGVARVHAVQARQRVHVHAVAAGAGPPTNPPPRPRPPRP